MTLWERLLAMFLGIVVLPLTVLYYSTVFLIFLLKNLIVNTPVLFTILLERWRGILNLPSYGEILDNIVVDTLLAMTIIFLVPGKAFLLFIEYFFEFAYKGMVQGYNEGMVGYNRLHGELRQIFEELNVNHKPHSVPKYTLLTEDELNQAKQVIASSKQAALPSLTTKIERYKALLSTLNKVQVACTNSNYSEIEDQLSTYTDIQTPLLLEKLYLGADNIWHAVPVQTYISDKNSFERWISEGNTHPLTRDNINKPSEYNGQKTRYNKKVLTAENCDAIELYDLAGDIRALLKEVVPKQATAIKPENSAPGTFFAAAPAAPAAAKNDSKESGPSLRV